MKNLFRRVKSLWKDLPIAHKLYSVVGVMAILIATELFTLLFAMNILSAVRAFVGGEGLWSKAQKNAIIEIQNYARTHDERHYQAFQRYLTISLGDHEARVEMQKPNMDINVVIHGFTQGGIHAHDILPMVQLMRRFHGIDYIHRAIVIWGDADELIFQLIKTSNELHEAILASPGGGNGKEIHVLFQKIFKINHQLTELENNFSSTLGEASRWLEHTLMILLIIAVATVESTGLLLTIAFSRGLSRALSELQVFASDVGNGNFLNPVQVRSSDELGQLAEALNKMAANLKEVSGERQVAERANKIKNLFLANMSHEIRTPLNAILGFVDLLKENSISKSDRTKYLDIIERTGNGLATIINDILDISKVEAGKLEIEKSICAPRQMLKDLETLFDLRCEAKGIDLKIKYEVLPEFIVTDPSRFKQILFNIIGNAIKFTAQGSVTVTFKIESQHLICTVEDTGIGIPPESREKLFQPFSQVDLSIRKQFGGTGLGLILSKRLAQMLGGDVHLLRSQVGNGSTFVVLIALVDALAQPGLKAPAIPSAQPGSLVGKRVLLVEDSLDNQLLAQQFLIREGAEIHVANNGQEALEATLKSKYDIVLMDMQMPIMDGYTATAQLRKDGFQTPIVALTAHAMKDDLQKCINAGCDDYLCKPFQRSHLINLVRRHCQTAA